MFNTGELFSGLKVVVSEMAIEFFWVYPEERFWKYIPSPETEKWCRFFGYGHQGSRPGSFIIDDTFLVHPVVWENLKRHLRSVEQQREQRFLADIAGPGRTYVVGGPCTGAVPLV